MDTSEKAQQELEEIERQAAQMQSASGQTDETRRQLGLLQQRIETLRKQLVRTNAMEKTELARHMQRPHTLDYIERIFTDWSEIHGDRRFGDDPAMVCGMARFHGDEVVVVGTEKGRDTKARMFRNGWLAGARAPAKCRKTADRDLKISPACKPPPIR